MALTVGIATTGADPLPLRKTVEGVLRSASLVSDDAEVLVVVNGRGRVPELDGLGSPMLRVRYLERANVAVARNTVLAEARHDTILFTDDDCAVPREWCRQLATALWQPGCVAVGAPVRIPVAGPVSAYCDYQRIYDAVPAYPGGPLLLVTTNCGLRRDRIPVSIRFDPALNTAGEDTGFSLALGKAGMTARWLADATPIRHGFSERVEEVTWRFMRNAGHSVRLFLGGGYLFAALPGALDLYRQRLREDLRLDRRYGELVAPEARTAFAVYDYLAAVVGMVAYLDRLGTELNQPLLELELPELHAGFHWIAERVAEQTAGLSTSEWASLEVDYAGMRDRLGEPEPLLGDVRAVLRRHAAPIPDEPDGPARDILNHGVAEASVTYLDWMDRLSLVFDELRAAPEPVTRDALDRAARAAGVSFKTATDMLELRLLVDHRQRLRRAR
jgi:glycosyltransferase involved in cell wall biosynthesis